MSKHINAKVLQKLIHIKQQNAERKLAGLRRTKEEIKSHTEAKQMALAQLGKGEENFDSLKDAVINRFPDRLIRELKTLEVQERKVRDAIHQTEQECRINIYAQSQLRKMNS
jgi:hypothetical protein